MLGFLVAIAFATSLVLSGPVAAETVKTISQATLEEPNQKTLEVSTDELRRILEDRSTVVFDARPPKEYALSHIPGALNVSGKPGLPMSQYVPDVGARSSVRWATKRNRQSFCTVVVPFAVAVND